MVTNGKQKEINNNAEELDIKQRTNATIITDVLFTGEKGERINGFIISSILLREEQLEDFENQQSKIGLKKDFMIVKEEMENLFKKFMRMD